MYMHMKPSLVRVQTYMELIYIYIYIHIHIYVSSPAYIDVKSMAQHQHGLSSSEN